MTTMSVAGNGKGCPRVSIIVLNWNSREMTSHCVRLLEESSYTNVEIVLVDNGSTDGSEAAFRKAFPQHVVLQTGTNLGYAGGNAVGVKYALEQGADFVCIVNSDLRVERRTIELVMDAAARNGRRCLVSPQVFFADTSRVYYDGLCIRSTTGAIVAGGQERGSGDVECDLAQGSFLLISREILETCGFLREDFFLYFEDFEYCIRLKKCGVRCICARNAIAYHLVGGSSGNRFAREYYRTRNQILMLRLHFSAVTYSRYLVFLLLRKLRQILVSADRDVLGAVVRGVGDGISGKSGSYETRRLSSAAKS